MPKASPNCNFSSLAGDVHTNTSPAYQNYRKLWNQCPQEFIVRNFPIHLDIEATNRCNLKCSFCDKLPYLSKDDFCDLDPALFYRIIDEGAEKGLMSLKLSYRGEPLLHPKIVDFVSYAKKKGLLDIYFNTNGMLLTEETGRQLTDAGLDRISISVEGTDPEIFERERRGASFSRIQNNIENFIRIRDSLNSPYPKVRVQTVGLKHINLDDYVSYWSPRCDEVAVIDFKEGSERVSGLVAEDWACPQLWQRMTIECNGAVIPCNNDDYRLLSPGNANQMSIEDCWHSEFVEQARVLHRRGKSHELQACNGCPWRSTQVLKSKTTQEES